MGAQRPQPRHLDQGQFLVSFFSGKRNEWNSLDFSGAAADELNADSLPVRLLDPDDIVGGLAEVLEMSPEIGQPLVDEKAEPGALGRLVHELGRLAGKSDLCPVAQTRFARRAPLGEDTETIVEFQGIQVGLPPVCPAAEAFREHPIRSADLPLGLHLPDYVAQQVLSGLDVFVIDGEAECAVK